MNEHAGFSNAFTCEEHTNYFFDVAPDGLYGALDRFAQFFIAPLFDPSGTEREMRAVDSENKKNLNNDHWRMNQLDKHLSSPEHPYHKFGTGNLETLSGAGIRETLLNFHERFYSANMMKLVVYGRESLEQLQNWVVELFSAVKNNSESKRPDWPGLPWNIESESFKQSQLVKVKTLKAMRNLDISWLIPDQRSKYHCKPDQYLTHLIGHEGEGSLFQALKKRGWLTSLCASCEASAHGFNFFQVSLELSPLGWQEYESVVSWLVQYISLLRHWGPQEAIFHECQQLSEISFRFREKGDPSTFTHTLAEWMHQFQQEPRLILAGAFLKENFDAESIRELCAHLTVDRMRITMASSEGLDGPQTEPWYGTEYKATAFDPEFLAKLAQIESNVQECAELYLPAPNPFLPERFIVPICPALEEPKHAPERIHENQILTLWYKQDDTFEQPKSQVNLIFRSGEGKISSSALRSQQALLFKDLLKHTLILYDAKLAGLNYEFAVLAEGFEVKISGFSDKLAVLLEACLKAILHPNFSEVDFRVIQDRQLRSLQNFPREVPYWHASFHLNGFISEPFYPIAERLEALQSMQPAEQVALFNANYFKTEILNGGRIEMLVLGSFSREEAVKSAQVVESLFGQQSSTTDDGRQKIVKLPQPAELTYAPPESTALDNPNCAIEVFFSIGTLDNQKLRTLTALFVQMFSESFFDTLRTNEQLGYIVTHGLREKGVLGGLRFLIQSERDPLYLESRIEAFLAQNVPKTLASTTESDFKQHCTALKSELTQKKKTLAGEAKQHWDAILSGSFDFERPWVDASLLDSVTLGEVTEFYQQYLARGGQKRCKLSVQIWNLIQRSGRDIPVAEGNSLITDRKNFIQELQSFYPTTYSIAN